MKLLRTYISNAIILESNKQGTAGWVLKSGSLEDRRTLYNGVVDLVISMSNQRKSIEEVYNAVVDRFGNHELFNSSRFNYRSVQNLKSKFSDRVTVNMQKGPRNLKFPGWVLKSGSLEDRHVLYNNVLDLIFDTSNQRKSIEEVYNTVVDRFGNHDLFDSSRFNYRSVNNLKAKFRDRVTVNMQKGPRDYNPAPAKWVLKSGPLKDRRTLYSDVVDLVIDMTNQRKSIEEIYNLVLDRFGNHELFDSSRFNYRSVQNLKSKFSDRVTVNMQKGPRNLKFPGWVLRSGSLEDRRALYNSVVDLIINLTKQGKKPQTIYNFVINQFGNHDLFDSSRFTKAGIYGIKNKS